MSIYCNNYYSRRDLRITRSVAPQHSVKTRENRVNTAVKCDLDVIKVKSRLLVSSVGNRRGPPVDATRVSYVTDLGSSLGGVESRVIAVYGNRGG